MRQIHGLDALAATDLQALYGNAIESRSAVLVGVFDGVHLGHQRLLHELLELASEHHCLPTVVTFANHPDLLLNASHPDSLTSFPHRLRLLRRAGVRRVLSLDFDTNLRDLDAAEFTERVLVRGLQTRALLLGHDSALGRDRGGTPERMRQLGAEHGFVVRRGSAFEVDGEPVSSTAIRRALAAGDLAQCERLLGRWPTALGTVVAGDQRGRRLGYPTANLQPEHLALPPAGVYAVEIIHAGETYDGVANLGPRPSYDTDAGPPRLEVHLLDFDGDLYGTTLEVGFVAHLREPRRFDCEADLRVQIGQDLLAAKSALGPGRK